MHRLFLFLFTALSFPTFIRSSPVKDPRLVVQRVQEAINASRRMLATSSCRTGNPIDDCWRRDKGWDKNPQHLAECAIGFGNNATGGKHGKIYEVLDTRDDPVNHKPGSLWYGVIQDEPLCITFSQDMVIKLKQDLRMNSFKTIDGRGANVHIAGGPCVNMHNVTKIIIHGINIHDCKREGEADVRDSPRHTIRRKKSDGDGISINMSSHIWVDHCSISRCPDGLIDASHGSTTVTISNNHMTDHNKVMLLGHSDSYKKDRKMQVTIAFNHSGCRHGYFHVVNNDYIHWQTYAIGGSAAPTINDQGNRFLAADERFNKEVTKRENTPEYIWKKWNWRSEGDLFLNRAYFIPSGSTSPELYANANSMEA